MPPTEFANMIRSTTHLGMALRPVRYPFPRRSLFSGLWPDAPVVVPNTGSIARDVLAAERTFLAWSRTGLGFVGAGSAMFATYHRRSQNFRNNNNNNDGGNEMNDNDARDLNMSDDDSIKSLIAWLWNADHDENNNNDDDNESFSKRHIYPASALLVVNGAFLLIFATRRYLVTVSALLKDQFPIQTRGTLSAIAITAASTLTSLALVLHAEFAATNNHNTRQISRPPTRIQPSSAATPSGGKSPPS